MSSGRSARTAIPALVRGVVAVALAWVAFHSTAAARPTAPQILCNMYPELPDCSGKVLNCAHCHDSTYPPSWNDFGLSVLSNLPPDTAFEEGLPSALSAIEDDDADGDGLSNLEEMRVGTSPGDADSGWTPPPEPENDSNPRYDVGNYDPEFAYKRVSILYCGRSPSYEEMEEFTRDSPDDDTLRQRLHDALSECLASDYWDEVALPRLADERIRPLGVLGPETDLTLYGLRIVVGNYNYDYRLWRYLLTEDRDMRELLTAQYHVAENENGELEEVQGVIDKPDPSALGGGQPVPEEHRAGMLTTQWFLAINTMFGGMPRTTAAQAYRSYLGADLSNNDGIRPVEGEPDDVDHKGVAAPRCATCHSTLDPMAYAFADYHGIGLTGGLNVGTYDPERPTAMMDDWDAEEQQPVVLGQEVDDLVEWAKVAAESDAFARNMAEMFYEHALGRGPAPDEQEAFKALWQSMPEDGYSANRLIHRLIDIEAFGRP